MSRCAAVHIHVCTTISSTPNLLNTYLIFCRSSISWPWGVANRRVFAFFRPPAASCRPVLPTPVMTTCVCMHTHRQTHRQTDTYHTHAHTHTHTHARVRQSVSRSPCKTLQDTASHCYTRRTSISSESIPSEESSSSDPSSLSSACVYASVLQCVAAHSGVLQCVAEIFLSPIINILCVCVCGRVAVYSSAFECVAVCCRALHKNSRPYVLL